MPMLSYTNRRKRWWSVLQELDSTMMLSDSLRAELLLDPCDQSMRHSQEL